jgi:PAS domain S-box-containing protein
MPFEGTKRIMGSKQNDQAPVNLDAFIRQARGLASQVESLDVHQRQEVRRALSSLAASMGGELPGSPQPEQPEHLAFFEALFEFTPDAIIVVDQTGEIRMANQQVKAMFGYRREELIGRPVEDLMPGSMRDRHKKHVAGYIQQPRVRPMGQQFELYALRKDGIRFPVDITLGPLQTREGLMVLASIRDISERKAVEEELSLYRDQLEERVKARTSELEQEVARRRKVEASLQEYSERLAASNRELEDFASIISHDLNEPLRKIRAFGERLANQAGPELGEEGKDNLDRVLDAAARMQNLLNTLLAYSRVSTQPRTYQPVDLNQVIQETLSDLEVRLEETGGEVQVEDLPVVQAEPLQMRQLFQNLIGNGLKYHRLGVPPRVKIWAERVVSEPEGSLHCLYVADNGIGFEEKHQSRIFKPFTRLHGRSEYEGVGMGLAICRRIVEGHGGQIRAESRLGEGTTFIVELPVEPVQNEAGAPEPG